MPLVRKLYKRKVAVSSEMIQEHARRLFFGLVLMIVGFRFLFFLKLGSIRGEINTEITVVFFSLDSKIGLHA